MSAQSATSASQPRLWLMGKSAFERRMPHHDGIAVLWETMWTLPCTKAVYPFHDGMYEDFEPVFKRLIADHVNDGTSTEFTEAFFPTAERLELEADETVQRGDKTLASALSLQAACVLRIVRFPYITAYPRVNDPVNWTEWEWQKAVYMKAGSGWTVPLAGVDISHVFRKGADRNSIPVYVRVPQSTPTKKWPVVLALTSLDGYRPDFTVPCDELLLRGWAVILAEVSGTADCPADSADKKDQRFDMGRVLCWGLSTGGYYADGHEYPFQLSPAFAMKHGFESVKEYKQGVQKKFSLLELGVIQKPSTRLLLLNGTLDGLMPIEDSMMLFEYNSPKEARFFPGASHMGNPMAFPVAYRWMEEVMASK